MNRIVVTLTLCVVATGLVSRTQQTERTASNAEPMKKFDSGGHNAARRRTLSIASYNEEARVFHWRLTMPPDLGPTMSARSSR